MASTTARTAARAPIRASTARAASTATPSCSTNGFLSVAAYGLFGAGLVYGMLKQQRVHNTLAENREAEIAKLEALIDEKDKVIVSLGGTVEPREKKAESHH